MENDAGATIGEADAIDGRTDTYNRKSNGDATGNAGKPRSVADDIAGSDQPKKRGRPRKSADTGSDRTGSYSATGKRTAKEKADILENLAFQLKGIHELAALYTGLPVLQLTEDESKKLAVAARDVMQYYNFMPDPKVMAWVELLGVSAVIYIPRILLIKAEHDAHRTNMTPDRASVFDGVVIQPTD